MDHRLPRGVPAVRLSSRLQLATTFGVEPSPSSRRGARRGPPPAMTADVRVVIRRHFPVVGPGGTRIAEKVAQDIALRRRPSRRLRLPESVGRALADEVLPLVAHPFDRGAVVAGMKPICARVGAACAEQRVAPRAPPACWSWSTPSRGPSCFALSLSSRCSLLSCRCKALPARRKPLL